MCSKSEPNESNPEKKFSFKNHKKLFISLYFDRNRYIIFLSFLTSYQGHYVEDVTIGSIADKCGLKVGDRIKEVNHRNIESEIHETVVARVRESGDTVHMNVLSVNSDQIREVVAPRRVNINKEKGTFGFYIFQDDKGQSS